MRYLVALIIGIGALFGVNAFADLFSMPRPWNSLLMGATVGITMVVVLLIWEVVKPSNKGAAPAKPEMSEEERANARAERRARLAAEAGVSLDDSDRSEAKDSEAKDEDAASPDSDESSIEAAPTEVEATQDEDSDTSLGADSEEPETLAPDEFNEQATGSSLESPPAGEPGVSADSLESAESEPESEPESDSESTDVDESSDDDDSGDETVPGGPAPKS